MCDDVKVYAIVIILVVCCFAAQAFRMALFSEAAQL